MARTIKKASRRIEITFAEGDPIVAYVRSNIVTIETAPEFAARHQTAALNKNRLDYLEQEARNAVSSEDYTRIMNEIEQIRPKANQSQLSIDYACALIERFEDYYLTEADEKAGRGVEVKPEILKQCDPVELFYIITQINEKLSLTGEEGKDSSASLQDGSQTKATEPAAPPTSIQSMP